MANDISSQITLNQVRPVDQGEKAARTVTSSNSTQQASVDSVNKTQVPLESVSNRQDPAVNQNQASENDGSTVVFEKAALEQAVSDINDYVQTVNRELQFRVDDALPLGRSIITVIDADTKETIREFPSEEALSLARFLKEQSGEPAQDQIEGLIISARA